MSKSKRKKQLPAIYRKTWVPVSEMSRSFFLWKGKRSFSPKEAQIAKILKENNLRFYQEISFDMVKRFDFYIPLVDLVIEYDGKQHFSTFKEMENDILKEKILARAGVKLIRYNKNHSLKQQIEHDLIHHPVLKNAS